MRLGNNATQHCDFWVSVWRLGLGVIIAAIFCYVTLADENWIPPCSESQQPALRKPWLPEIGRFGTCVDNLGSIGEFMSWLFKEALQHMLPTGLILVFIRKAKDDLLRILQPEFYRRKTWKAITDQSAFEDIVSIQLNFVDKNGTFQIRTVYDAPLKQIIIDKKSLDFFEDAKEKIKKLSFEENTSTKENLEILPEKTFIKFQSEECKTYRDECKALRRRLERLIEGKISEIFAQGHLDAALCRPNIIDKEFKWVMIFECSESSASVIESVIQSKYRILLVDQALFDRIANDIYGHPPIPEELPDEACRYFQRRWRILELVARKMHTDDWASLEFFSGGLRLSIRDSDDMNMAPGGVAAQAAPPQASPHNHGLPSSLPSSPHNHDPRLSPQLSHRYPLRQRSSGRGSY